MPWRQRNLTTVYNIRQISDMKKLLLGQDPIWSNAILLLRVWVGVIFIYHGISILHTSNMHNFADFCTPKKFRFHF